jgi:hypothetical protein
MFCNYHVSSPREATRREESQSTDSWATQYQTQLILHLTIAQIRSPGLLQRESVLKYGKKQKWDWNLLLVIFYP